MMYYVQCRNNHKPQVVDTPLGVQCSECGEPTYAVEACSGPNRDPYFTVGRRGEHYVIQIKWWDTQESAWSVWKEYPQMFNTQELACQCAFLLSITDEIRFVHPKEDPEYVDS